jgi:hypothetical protein
MVLTETRRAGSADARCVKGGGPGFRPVGAEMTGGREMNPIGCSRRTRLASLPCSPGPLCNTGSSRLARCFSEPPLCHESRNPSASTFALANAGPHSFPDRVFIVFIATAIGNGTDGLTNKLREADHRHTVESGTATREVWSLSLTGFYSRSSQPAEFGCGLSQTDISRLSCE